MKNRLKMSWQLLTLLLFLIMGVQWIVFPEFFTYNFVFSLFCLSLLSIQIFLARKFLCNLLKRKDVRNYVTNLITIVLVALILGMLNYMGLKNSRSFDMTLSQVHSLSDQSKQVVKNLTTPLKITLFAKRLDWENYLGLLQQYKNINKQIVLDAIDVDRSPEIVKANKITDNGSVLVEYQGRRAIGVARDELSVTNTLLRVIRVKQLNVYYTFGHGEIDFSNKAPAGASYLANRILESNWNLKPIDLLVSEVPIDADAVMLLSPSEGMLHLEIQKLLNFYQRGGNFIIAYSPKFSGNYSEKLIDFYREIGIEFVNAIVLDRLASVQGADASTPIVNTYNPEHAITKQYKHEKILMPLAAPVLSTGKTNLKYEWLLRTSYFPASWAEKNLSEVEKGRSTYGREDLKGPIDVVASIYNKFNQSKVVVFGSESFVSNNYQAQSANFNFFLNALAWVLDDEGIISLNRPHLSEDRIFMADSQVTLIFWGSIVIFPFVFFGCAIYFYRRRMSH